MEGLLLVAILSICGSTLCGSALFAEKYLNKSKCFPVFIFRIIW